MKKHTILFLAANPTGTDHRSLDQEARAIELELSQSGYRDRFDLETRWAAEPLDLLRELRKLRPTVVHFSGHGSQHPAEPRQQAVSCTAPAGDGDAHEHDLEGGLFFQGRDGRAQRVSAAALIETFRAAGSSVKLVVLNACYTEVQAKALATCVDCVVGMSGSIRDDAARSFAIGFYGGLGARESIAVAYQQGRAAISLEGLSESERPQLKVRQGTDANQLVLAVNPFVAPPASPTQAGLIDFAAERQRHAQFMGREDVLQQLNEWLDSPDEAGWVVVTGGPGMGKSAILSAWLARREAKGEVIPYHLVRRQVADWDQPEVIAASLTAQIEIAFPLLRDPDAKPERRLLELLGRVSKQIIAKAERLVVVVDGLDETRAEPDENPLPRFLPHVVPAGIRFLCATRPSYTHLNWMEARNPLRMLDLDAQQWVSSNDAVVREFWRAAAAEYQPPLSATTVAVAISRAEGNVLHAVMLHDSLRDLPVDEHCPDRIPRGLKELIGEVWDRAASHEAVRTGLGLLCAAQEALPLEMLAQLAGWSYHDKQRFVRGARQLLVKEVTSWVNAEAYRPRHDWVREVIAEQLGSTTIREHHATMLRTLAAWPAPSTPAAKYYILRHGLTHRAEAGEWQEAWRLASDMQFVEEKCRVWSVHDTEAELTWLTERCRAAGNEALGVRFKDLARAIARESHWLSEAPEATSALIWNRLRRLGWAAEDLAVNLQFPQMQSSCAYDAIQLVRVLHSCATL